MAPSPTPSGEDGRGWASPPSSVRLSIFRAVPLGGAAVGGIVAGRALGASAFGDYAVSVAIAALFGRLGSFGLPQSLMANISNAERSRRALSAGTLSHGLRASLPWAFLAALCSMVSAHTVGQEAPVVICCGSLTVAWAVSGVASGALRAVRREYAGVSLLAGPTSLLGMLGVGALVIQAAGGHGFETVMVTYTVVTIGSVLVVGGRLVWTHTLKDSTLPTTVPAVRENAQFAASQLVVDLYAVGDTWMIGYLSVTTAELGAYAAVKRIANLTGLPGTLAGLIVAPDANVSRREDGFAIDRSIRVSRAAAGLSTGVGMLALLATLAFGGQILVDLLGPSFDGAGVLLAIAMLGQLFNVSTGAVRVFLLQSGHQAATLAVEWAVLSLAALALLFAATGIAQVGLTVAVAAGVRFSLLAALLLRRERLWVGVSLPTPWGWPNWAGRRA